MALASTEFRDAADTQARALGLKDAQCVFVAHPIQDATDEEMQQKADAVISQVVEALTSGQ